MCCIGTCLVTSVVPTKCQAFFYSSCNRLSIRHRHSFNPCRNSEASLIFSVHSVLAVVPNRFQALLHGLCNHLSVLCRHPFSVGRMCNVISGLPSRFNPHGVRHGHMFSACRSSYQVSGLPPRPLKSLPRTTSAAAQCLP